MIEEDRSVDSAYARQELEKYERNVRRGRHSPTEGYNFYDITSWALPPKEGEEIPEPDSSAAEANRRPQYIPGTVFWATPDPRQWLTWGFPDGRIPVMLQGNTMLTPTTEGANALRFDRVPLTVTGWTWPNTAFAIDEPSGDGHVVMLTGPVLFRSYWRNTERLLTNALLYAPALD